MPGEQVPRISPAEMISLEDDMRLERDRLCGVVYTLPEKERRAAEERFLRVFWDPVAAQMREASLAAR